jgi:hypothetical protein
MQATMTAPAVMSPEALIDRLRDYCRDVLMRPDWVPIRGGKSPSAEGNLVLLERGSDRVVIGTTATPPPILMDACRAVTEWYWPEAE